VLIVWIRPGLFRHSRRRLCILLIAAAAWTSHGGGEQTSCLLALARPARAGLEPGGGPGPACHPLDRDCGPTGFFLIRRPWKALIQNKRQRTGRCGWIVGAPARQGVGAAGAPRPCPPKRPALLDPRWRPPAWCSGTDGCGRCAEAVRGRGGRDAPTPVSDTIKRLNGAQQVRKPWTSRGLWARPDPPGLSGGGVAFGPNAKGAGSRAGASPMTPPCSSGGPGRFG